MVRTSSPLLSLLALAACSQAQNSSPPEAAQEEPQRELMAADLAFAADARARGVADAFSERFLSDGKLIAAGAPVAVGPEAIRKLLADDKMEWSWAPDEAAASGDLGVTWGRATIAPRNGRGEIIRTRYVTVWKRDPAGNWRIWLDIGNRAPKE